MKHKSLIFYPALALVLIPLIALVGTVGAQILPDCIPGETVCVGNITLSPGVGNPSGGIPISSNCPSVSALTGIEVKTRDYLRGARSYCNELVFDPTSGDVTTTNTIFKDTSWIMNTPGAFLTNQQSICPSGMVVVGYRSRSGSLVDGVQVICQLIEGYTPVGARIYGNYAGGSGGILNPDVFCPPEQVAVGISGRAGDGLDYISLQCAPLRHSTTILSIEMSERGWNNPPQPSCPFLYGWDGTAYQVEDHLFPAASTSELEYTDYLVLEGNIVPKDGAYSFEIREIPGEQSWTDMVRLMTIDHPAGVEVGLDSAGNAHSYVNPFPPDSAIDSSGNNVLAAISQWDDSVANIFHNESLVLDFTSIDISEHAKLVGGSSALTIDGVGNPTGALNGGIHIQTLEQGEWITRYTAPPPCCWDKGVWDLKPYLGESQKVRIVAFMPYDGDPIGIDYMGLDTTADEELTISYSDPETAVLNGNQDVLSNLLDSDNNYVHTVENDVVSVAFPIPSIPPADLERTIVIVNEGYWQPVNNTYDIQTWNGSSWISREMIPASSIDTIYSINLSSYLPDPDGQYKVRIENSMASYENLYAYVDQVSMRINGIDYSPSYAKLFDTWDILSQVKDSDDFKWNALNKWAVIKFIELPPNDLFEYGDHYYELINEPIGWNQANELANAAEFESFCGHLVTITSQGEQEALFNEFGSRLFKKYFGGYQTVNEPADAGWAWVTGETWDYTNWYPGDPNDGYEPGSEQYLMGWHEPGNFWADAGPNMGEGYVIEYEGCNLPPEANAGGPYSGNEGSDILMYATASDPDGDGLTYSWSVNSDLCSFNNSSILNPNLTCSDNDDFIAKLEVSDGTETDISEASITVTNVAPVVTLTGPTTADEGDTISFSYTVADPGDETFTLDVETCGTSGMLSNSSFTPATGAGSFDCTFPDGPATTDVSVTVSDDDGGSGSADLTVTVSNVAPVVTLTGPTTADEGDIVSFSYTVADPGDEIFFLDVKTCGTGGTLSNSSFNPATGAGSFDCTFPDGPATTDVSVTVSDDDGGSGSADLTVTVSNVAPTLGEITPAPLDPVVAAGTSVNFDAPFSDPAGDQDNPYNCAFDWDGDDTVDENISVSYGSCNASHTYPGAGIYTIKLIVTDKDGGVSNRSIFQYVVVYDPSAGFVTGGGWIYSAAGVYVPDPLLEGKANFGFVSRYQKNATVPSGNTQFQFQTADLNFHSNSYQWLVVTGSNYARFKGEGTINGALDSNGNAYKFMIWAGDGTGTDGSDTFCIKIWQEDESGNETVIYDNGFDQAIGGGSIVVHDK